MPNKHLFTIKELAEYLKMQPITIYKHAAAGKLPGFKVGSKWRFKKSTIDRWIEEQENSRYGKKIYKTQRVKSKKIIRTKSSNRRFPNLAIGDLKLELPIIQGGMGVRISKANLTSAVSECGGMGVIASVGLGDEFESLNANYTKTSEKALRQIIKEVKKKTKRPFGVNIMVALSNYESLCKVCADEKVNAIFSGAGLPLKLPSFVEDKHIKLIPIISSARAADVILKYWTKRYNRIPDAFVVEGPLAGGHLGFSKDELRNPKSLFEIIREVKNLVNEDSNSKNTPVIAAGGIFTGKDILKVLKRGANGVQMSTRFIATNECDAPDELKQVCLNAKKEDVVIIDSPLGLPGRVLKNEFVERILQGEKIKFKCPYKCLKTCKRDEAQFCIAIALVNASRGNFKEGFVMPGSNVYRLNKIISVKELFEELREEAYSDE